APSSPPPPGAGRGSGAPQAADPHAACTAGATRKPARWLRAPPRLGLRGRPYQPRVRRRGLMTTPRPAVRTVVYSVPLATVVFFARPTGQRFAGALAGAAVVAGLGLWVLIPLREARGGGASRSTRRRRK